MFVPSWIIITFFVLWVIQIIDRLTFRYYMSKQVGETVPKIVKAFDTILEYNGQRLRVYLKDGKLKVAFLKDNE